MKLAEFNKLRDERAKQSWDEAFSVWDRHKNPICDRHDTVSFLIQWCLKEIAATQIMVEKLVEHTKMPKVDE